MRTYLDTIIICIVLSLMTAIVTVMLFKVIGCCKPIQLNFVSDIKVIQEARRVCLKANNTFVILEVTDGWKIGCRI